MRNKTRPADFTFAGSAFLSEQPHTRGSDDLCTVCGEPFLCLASINAREARHQVVPSAALYARDTAHQLRAIYERMVAFERALSRYVEEGRVPRARHARLVEAIRHLAAALNALERAGRE